MCIHFLIHNYEELKAAEMEASPWHDVPSVKFFEVDFPTPVFVHFLHVLFHVVFRARQQELFHQLRELASVHGVGAVGCSRIKVCVAVLRKKKNGLKKIKKGGG